MAIQVSHITEVLLQLVYAYQGLGDRGPTPDELWCEIAVFIGSTNPRSFAAYRLAGIDVDAPNAQFLGDLGNLIREGHLKLQVDGRLGLTATGRCLAFARALPESLRPLENQVLEKWGSLL